jgi:hypothetical protein
VESDIKESLVADDIIRRFHAALPQVGAWIDRYIQTHAASARQVSTLGFKRLSVCYPKDLLERAKVVSVDRVPYPPVESFGLPEFASMQQMPFAGITFKDTFFIQRGRESEELLHFHELVHVVQWARLGVDKFLLAYGLGLRQYGYENSPLEAMAYGLQQGFESGTLPNNLVDRIEQSTDSIWSQAAQFVSDGGT